MSGAIVTPDTNFITLITEQHTVVSSSAQGPQGIQGIQGIPGFSSKYYAAAESIGGHSVVRLMVGQLIIKANCNQYIDHSVAGITDLAVAIGEVAEVYDSGPITHLGWTWTANLPIYLGMDGSIVQSLPPEALYTKVLGMAVSPTMIVIDIQPAIFFN